MRVVFPEARADAGAARTLTQTVKALTPTRTEAADATALIVLAGIALLGLANTFDTWQFWAVGILGTALGIAATHLVRVVRWPWLAVAPLVAAEFLLVGPVVAAREDALFGALPTSEALGALGRVALEGWKELLTTVPPVDGAGPFLALPYLLGLCYGAVGFALAARRRRAFLPLLAPVGLLGAAILLGTLQPPSAAGVGLAFTGAAFLWASRRHGRRRRLVGAGSGQHPTRRAFGAALLAVSLAGGLLVGPALPGAGTERLVLRTLVQPPVDLGAFASPLESFRQYSSAPLQRFYDQPLLDVEGAPAAALLRLGVLDDYSGRAWSATSGSGPLGFQRVGAGVPNETSAGKVRLRITVQTGYASAAGPLAMWVPSLGDTSSVGFEGPHAKNHAAQLRINLADGQGVVLDRLAPRDVVVVTTSALPTTATDTSPGGAPLVTAERSSFVAPAVARLSGPTGTPWERLGALAAAFKNGAWSDGTLTGEKQYLPGHGQRRLGDFLAAPALVGSDEQYAAAFALVASHLGYPARVVLGAVVPADGRVAGKDVHAWVEVQTRDGWITLPPSFFMPDRSKRPAQTPQAAAQNAASTDVPPPNPARAPGSIEDLADAQLSAATIDNGLKGPGAWERLWAILALVAPPVGALAALLGGTLAAKALRCRRRRTVGTPAHRVAAGWRELVDLARDLRATVPAGATRLEQSRAIGFPALPGMAERANALVFGAETPSAAQADEFWRATRATKAAMMAVVPRGRRLLARLSLRSLLPGHPLRSPAPITPGRRGARAPRRRRPPPPAPKGRP